MSESLDRVNVLKTICAHRQYLQIGLEAVSRKLTERGLHHDMSKFSDDEFAGFARINRIAREHPYGSEEYKQSMKDEGEVIGLHYSRNSHHPEYHEDLSAMGFFDIVEMVCDWWSARHTYGKSQPWDKTLEIQKEGFAFTPEQWWLIEEVARFLESYEQGVMGNG